LIKQCNRCKLSTARLCIVRPWGPSPADALFLVEAPTAADERLKELGRTPEYRLLASLVCDAADRLGIHVPSYRIHPIISCRPATSPQHPDRPPAHDEILACAPHVMKAVDQANAGAIFFMGKTVEHYWRKEYPEGKTLSPLWLLMKQGGTQSPYYTGTVRAIAEGIKHVTRNQGIDRAIGGAGPIADRAGRGAFLGTPEE
jgi:uracil-DNA glycosylase family 4